MANHLPTRYREVVLTVSNKSFDLRGKAAENFTGRQLFSTRPRHGGGCCRSC